MIKGRYLYSLEYMVLVICFNLQHIFYFENALLMKSALISNIECYIYVHMYDFMTQINLILVCCEEKSDPKLNKTVSFGKIKRFLKKKSLPIHCGMGVCCFTCPNLTRTMHRTVLF